MHTPESLCALIDSGMGPHRLAPLVGGQLEAYSFFAKTMQDRHRLEDLEPGARCLCCGSLLGHPAEVEWSATLNKLKTGPADLLLLPTGHLKYQNTTVPMNTYHVICHACTQRINRRRVILKLSDGVLFFCLVASLLGAVPLTVFAIGLPWFAPETLKFFGPAALAAICVLGLVIWAMGAIRSWAVPVALRNVGKSWFTLVVATQLTSNRTGRRIGATEGAQNATFATGSPRP
jgi:branched-subunit amino acid transport protein